MLDNYDLVPQDDGFYVYEASITAQFDIRARGTVELQPKWSKHKLVLSAATIDEATAKAHHAARYLTERDFACDGDVVNFRVTSCVVQHNVGEL